MHKINSACGNICPHTILAASRVNVKHVIGQLAEIAVGAEVVMRFNANGGLSPTANFCATRCCNSTDDSSSLSSSCWLRYSAILRVILDGRPHCALSSSPLCFSQRKIHFLIVVRVVSLPSALSIPTMEEILWPCVHNLTMR